MKRTIILLLIFCMLVCCSVSCADEDDVIPPQTKQSIIEKYGFTDTEFTDYGGYEYRILTVGSLCGEHWAAYEFHYDDTVMGDALNEAVMTRDNELSALHNVKVSYIEKEGITDYARQAILSGADEFDLITDSLGGAAILSGMEEVHKNTARKYKSKVCFNAKQTFDFYLILSKLSVYSTFIFSIFPYAVS